MKKSIFTMVLSLFLISLNMEVNAQQNFTVSLKMPPPGTLNASDFWNVTVINNSGSEQSGYLTGSAKEDRGGMIAKGTTVPILFKKGINNIKIKDLPKTPDVEYTASDPRYKESLIRQGKFPSGKYEICVKVISAATNEELGSDCINQEVLETGLLTLITPADGEDIESKVPVTFTWSSGGKVPEGGYTLRICEVMKNQTPETAMKGNKAWFEKKGIKSTTFTYPNSAKGLEVGKKYAWVVNSGKSESEIFSIVLNRYDEREITLISPKSNEPIKDKKNIKFEWEGEQPKEGYTLTIFEINEEQFKEITTNKEAKLKIEKPLYEKTGIRENQFTFNDSSINFQATHHYGWGIRSGTRSQPWWWSLNPISAEIAVPFFVLNITGNVEGDCFTDFNCEPSTDNNGFSFYFLPNDGLTNKFCLLSKVPRGTIIPDGHGSWEIDPAYPYLDAAARYDQLINNNPPYSSFYNSSSNEWTNIIWSGTVGNTNYPNDPVIFETGDLGANGVTYHNVYHNWYNPATNSYGIWVNEWEYWYILGIECPESGNWKTYLLRDYGSDFVQRMSSESNITLISPRINEQLTGKNNINFEWEGELPKEGFALSIFEIDENQYKEISKNKDIQLKIEKPLFERKGIRENHFNFSDSSINFQDGHHYGWGVRNGSRSGPWLYHDWNSMTATAAVLRPLDMHVLVEENMEAWGDDNHDGIKNELEDGYGGQIITGYGNQFVVRWKFNDPSFFDADLVGLFVVKIVTFQQDPVPLGYESPVGSGNWITPQPRTCSDYMLNGNEITLTQNTVPYTPGQIMYGVNMTNPVVPNTLYLMPGQRYRCQVSIGNYISNCFTFVYMEN